MASSEYIHELFKVVQQEFFKISLSEEKQIINIYEEAGKQLLAAYYKSNSKTLNQAYLKQYINSLYLSIAELMTKTITDIATLPVEFQQFILNEMAGQAKVNIKFQRMFTTIPKETLNMFIKSGIYKDGKGLSDRIWTYTTLNGKSVQDIVTTGLAQKLSAMEMAKQLEGHVLPSARTHLKGAIPKKIFGGRVEYNALRLARTTNSHVFETANIKSCQRNPFVEGLQWHTSKEHLKRMNGKRDICDEYNGQIFKLNEVPFDHPNGLCYQSPYISRDMSDIAQELKEWVNGGDNDKLDNWFQTYKKEIEIH